MKIGGEVSQNHLKLTLANMGSLMGYYCGEDEPPASLMCHEHVLPGLDMILAKIATHGITIMQNQC